MDDLKFYLVVAALCAFGLFVFVPLALLTVVLGSAARKLGLTRFLPSVDLGPDPLGSVF